MLTLFREFIAGICGYAILSFAILKVLWLVFGHHFYIPSNVGEHTAPLFFEIFAILMLTVCAIFLIAERIVALCALCAFCTIVYEYTVHHHDVHTVWQTALIVWLLTSLAISAIADVVEAFTSDEVEESHFDC